MLVLEQLLEDFDRPLRSFLQRGANMFLERAHEQLPFRQFEGEDHLRRIGGLFLEFVEGIGKARIGL